MADDKIALSIEIEADRAQMSLGELEEGFDGLREKLKATNRGTEEGRAAFKELSTQMAQTGAEIKNIELGFESLDQDQIASEFGGLAGGIGDVTASLVLMGGENETIEQMGKSIETAMAISMGFKGAIEGASAGMKLYNNMIKTGKLQVILYSAAAKAAAIATKALNLIMKANPIGLVVAGITAAVVAYKSFSKESKEASFAQTAFTDASNKAQIATVTQKIELNKLIKVAKDDTLSKRQRQAAIEDLNKLAPDYLGNITLETINTKEATAAIGAYIEGLERKARAAALQNELVRIETELIENNRTVREASDADYLASGIAEVKIEFLHEQKQAILDLMNAENNETDAYVGNSAKKAEADKAAAEAKKAADKAAADEAARLAKEKADRDKVSQKEWEDGAEARAMVRSKESQAKKDALMEDIEIAEVDRTLQTEELDRDTIHIEGLLSNQEILRDVKAKYAAEELERIEEERQARLLANQKGLESATQVIGAIGSLNSAALANDLKNAGDNEALKEKLRKASFEREKKLNIAMALINGAQAQMSILAQTPKADFGVATVIAMVAAAATTIGQIAAIKSTSYQGGGSPAVSESASVSAGGAGAAGGGAQITPVTNTSTILGNQQVYVTETDITNTQNNVSVIEESATF
jgi:hypothetical protein